VGLAIGGTGDRAGVELGAEPQPPLPIVGVDRGSGERDLAGGRADEVSQRR
jgi:hypothetical protein